MNKINIGDIIIATVFTKKRADIVIFDKLATTSPYIIVELKKPKLKDGKEQLKSCCNATGAPIEVWTNGGQIFFITGKTLIFLKIYPIFQSLMKKSTMNDVLNSICHR